MFLKQMFVIPLNRGNRTQQNQQLREHGTNRFMKPYETAPKERNIGNLGKSARFWKILFYRMEEKEADEKNAKSKQ